MATLLQLKSWWILLDAEWKRLLLESINATSTPTDAQLISICNLKYIFMNVPSEHDEDIEPYRLSSLSPLSMLSNLEDLTIQGDVEQISSLEPLRGLIKLRHLSITCAGIDDLSPLSDLINLESLSFNNCPVSDLEPIGRLFNLKQITGIGSHVKEFHPLLNLPQLSNADFWGDEVDMDSLMAFAGVNTSCQVNVLQQSMEMVKMMNNAEGMDSFFEDDERWHYDEAPAELQEEMDDMKDFIVATLEEDIPNRIGCDDLNNYRLRLNIDEEDYFVMFDYINGQVLPFLISNDRWTYTISGN